MITPQFLAAILSLILFNQTDDISLLNSVKPIKNECYQIFSDSENQKFESKEFKLINNNGYLYFQSTTDKLKCITIHIHSDRYLTYHTQIIPYSVLYLNLPRDLLKSGDLLISFYFTHKEKKIDTDNLIKIRLQ